MLQLRVELRLDSTKGLPVKEELLSIFKAGEEEKKRTKVVAKREKRKSWQREKNDLLHITYVLP